MKIRLQIRKQKTLLYEGVYDVADAESFGAACRDAWRKLREKRMREATSVGALMEMLNQNVLEDLSGAEIGLRKV
jgi:hypothetical protein